MSEFKILAISDIHMNNSLPHARPSKDGRTDRFDDQLGLWERVGKTAESEDVEAIFILGDLFDKALLDAVTLTHTAQAIWNLRTPVYILPGNHDAVSTSGGRFSVEAFQYLGDDLVTYIGGPRVSNVRFQPFTPDWLRFWPLPYGTMVDSKSRLAEIRKKTKEDVQEILLFHHSVLGCEHVGWTCDDGSSAFEPSELCEGFSSVIGGHFHTHQTFGENNQGRYLGAPMHHRFDDEGRDAGYWVVTFKEGAPPEFSFRDGGCPKFFTLDLKMKDGSIEVPDHSSLSEGDYARLRIKATAPDYAKMKPSIAEAKGTLEELGIKTKVLHNPIAQHETRMERDGDAEALSLEQAIERYPEAAGVVSGSLDLKKLRRIGREAIGEVRRTK